MLTAVRAIQNTVESRIVVDILWRGHFENERSVVEA